jgi:hypothetical protein
METAKKGGMVMNQDMRTKSLVVGIAVCLSESPPDSSLRIG